MRRGKNLLGCRFGRLVVVQQLAERVGGYIQWLCVCDCNSIHTARGSHLISGGISSCGCLRVEKHLKDITGQKFGRLLAVERNSVTGYWKCTCDCGKECTVRLDHLQAKMIRSCGCLQQESRTKHGLFGTKTYQRAAQAKRRALLLQRTPTWSDLEEIQRFYAECPPGDHVDHTLPLQGDLICGLHVRNNLQYLPAWENLSKGKKFEPYIEANAVQIG